MLQRKHLAKHHSGDAKEALIPPYSPLLAVHVGLITLDGFLSKVNESARGMFHLN